MLLAGRSVNVDLLIKMLGRFRNVILEHAFICVRVMLVYLVWGGLVIVGLL